MAKRPIRWTSAADRWRIYLWLPAAVLRPLRGKLGVGQVFQLLDRASAIVITYPAFIATVGARRLVQQRLPQWDGVDRRRC